MALARKRSCSDIDHRDSFDFHLPIQTHSRPATPRDRAFAMDLLAVGSQDEEEMLVQEILVEARALGVTIPDEPRPTADTAKESISTLTISSSSPASITQLSRTSQSTRPTSRDSSEDQFEQPDRISPTVASSLTEPSIKSPSPSIIAPSFKEGSYSKIRKSFRRLSTFTRRKSTTPAFSSPESSTQPRSRSATQTVTPVQRPATADSSFRPAHLSSQFATGLRPRKTMGTLLPSLSESRVPTLVLSHTLRPMTPPLEEMETREVRAARERTLRCHELQKVRISQLEEQSRFLQFRAMEVEKVRAQSGSWRDAALAAHEEVSTAARIRHAHANADMETRHLAAELELVHSLQQERKACDTKLKHMEAYCFSEKSLSAAPTPKLKASPEIPGTPKSHNDNLPIREVTADDIRKLDAQFQLRESMDNLHTSRINVLRERQVKQLERVAAKQEAELFDLETKCRAELDRIDAALRTEEEDLRRQFDLRKKKLIWRWKVSEAVARRRLELDRGEEYGELPDVIWGDEDLIFRSID